jgi:flagellar operon protein
MDDRFVILPRPIAPPGGVSKNPSAGKNTSSSVPFGRVLDAQLQSDAVKFSKHAASRMESRGITLDAKEVGRLQEAVDKAGAKGAKDSLVFLGEKALVVSIKNKTVVTVVDKENLKGNVFTNIDSAVIA